MICLTLMDSNFGMGNVKYLSNVIKGLTVLGLNA